jgi:hypothetical protein
MVALLADLLIGARNLVSDKNKRLREKGEKSKFLEN